MKNFIKIVIVSIITCFFMAWLIPYTRNEILTLRFSHEFTDLVESKQLMDESSYVKVLDYSKDIAHVYYVGSTGEVLTFIKTDGVWKLESKGWKTIWSDNGNADGFIWPYFYHSAKGTLVFTLLCLSIVVIIVILSSIRLHILSKVKKEVR